MKRAGSSIEPAVFVPAAATIIVLVVFAAVDPPRATHLFVELQNSFISWFGWLLVLATGLFPLVVIWAAWGATGRLRLGADDEKPTYGLPAWFAMLFTAGMGIGIMFYGVAEPIVHYATPPTGGLDPHQTARNALRITMFHWGLHAWGIYALMGLAIAFFGYRRGRPLSVRSPLEPLFGERIYGPIGHIVDILAVFGTLFGLATSLGLGSMQINAGLAALFGTPEESVVQVGIIALITAGATASVVLGLDKGIRRLSEANMVMAVGLLLFVLLAGPTAILLWEFGVSLVDYLIQLAPLTAGGGGLGDDEWLKSWTLFYWAWWIAWSPFVGVFIARISRGRTVREFVLGVLFVPPLVSCLWFTIFGWSAMSLDMASPGIAAAVQTELSSGIYALLSRLPLAQVSSIFAMVVVAVFFVTSSDSGSFVVDILTSGGHPNPPVGQRIFWAVSEGLVAAVLLLSGGLAALQAAAINTGLPFCIVLLLICWGLIRALRQEVAGKHS